MSVRSHSQQLAASSSPILYRRNAAFFEEWEMGVENHVSLIGHLGRDPEKAMVAGTGVMVATLNVATNFFYKNKTTGERQTGTDWHRVVFFDKNAENALDLLKKGSHVALTGRLRTRKWTDSKGVDRWTTEIIGDEFRLLDKKEVGNSPEDVAAGTGYEIPTPESDDIPL